VSPLYNGQTESYDELLDDYSHFGPPASNEVLAGTVLSITAKDVIVDFGYKSEGVVPREQFLNAAGEITVRPVDVVKVMIEHGEQPEGYVLLSHTRAARLRVWDNLEKAFQDQLVISGRVTRRVKGGLAVDVGLETFMPGSQADPRPIHNLDALIGQDVPVKIIKLNRRRGNVVVSRKLAVEEEVTSRKTTTLEHLSEGSVVTGVVKNLTEYGAFVDLGGIDGLLHVTDMSYGRVTHPSELLHVSDEVTVRILKFGRGKERVSLGMKQLEPDPWQTMAERYPVNSRVIGRVVNVTDYSAFVELDPGVEGLIHISEMTWPHRMKHPSKVVKPGDHVEAVVLEVHGKDRRISLGLKQLEPDPWETVVERYPVVEIGHAKALGKTVLSCLLHPSLDALNFIRQYHQKRRLDEIRAFFTIPALNAQELEKLYGFVMSRLPELEDYAYYDPENYAELDVCRSLSVLWSHSGRRQFAFSELSPASNQARP
jgi:small subunit ribosomal protein S1